MTNLMEEVMRSGTAAGVRPRGSAPRRPARPALRMMAGSSDTPRDLLCIVWVGFDDNRELDLEGAHSALPIWTEFMKRALQYRGYRNARPFEAPDGIVSAQIDPESGMLATPGCPTIDHRSLHLGDPAGDLVSTAWRRTKRDSRRRLGSCRPIRRRLRHRRMLARPPPRLPRAGTPPLHRPRLRRPRKKPKSPKRRKAFGNAYRVCLNRAKGEATCFPLATSLFFWPRASFRGLRSHRIPVPH